MIVYITCMCEVNSCLPLHKGISSHSDTSTGTKKCVLCVYDGCIACKYYPVKLGRVLDEYWANVVNLSPPLRKVIANADTQHGSVMQYALHVYDGYITDKHYPVKLGRNLHEYVKITINLPPPFCKVITSANTRYDGVMQYVLHVYDDYITNKLYPVKLERVLGEYWANMVNLSPPLYKVIASADTLYNGTAWYVTSYRCG